MSDKTRKAIAVRLERLAAVNKANAQKAKVTITKEPKSTKTDGA